MKVKVQMILLGATHRAYEKAGEKKDAYNIKMMDNESEIYDFYVPANNHTLLATVYGTADGKQKALPQMTPVTAVLEIGAYQMKPTVKLAGVEIATR